MIEEIRSYIRRQSPQYVSTLCELVRQPSISTEGIGISEAAGLVRRLLEDSGARAEVVGTPGHPAVIGECGTGAAVSVLIYGHYDVQPVGSLSEWESNPFEPVVRSGRVFGRGAADNKGQFLAQILAVRVLNDLIGRPPVVVRYIIEGEEEIGSPNLPGLLERHRDRLKSDLFLRADGAVHYSGRPQIVLGQKGMLYVELTSSCAAQEVHSMEAPVVPNPAWEVVHALSVLKSNGRIEIGGFYDGVRPLSPDDQEALRAIPFDAEDYRAGIGVDRLIPGLEGERFWTELHMRPTCNIAGISSGYSSPGMKTIIPPTASAKLDLRLVPDQDPDEIFEKLEAHLRSVGVKTVSVKKIKGVKPARTDLRHPVVSILREALSEAYGTEPLVVPISKGAGPAHVFSHGLGVPYVLIPCAQIDSNMHAPNENLEVEAFLKGIEATALALWKFGQQAERIAQSVGES